MQNIPSDEEKSPAPDGVDGKTSIGLKPNIAGALSYALIWIIGFVSNVIISTIIVFQIPTIGYNATEMQNKLIVVGIMSQFVAGVITCSVGGIFFLIEKENRFVRLHTIQAISLNVVNIAVSIILGVMTMALGSGIAVISLPLSIAFLVAWIFLTVKAYKGDMLKLPYIGDMAENIVTQSASTQPPSPQPESSEKMKTCPECAESIKDAARTCRFCGHKFSEVEAVR